MKYSIGTRYEPDLKFWGEGGERLTEYIDSSVDSTSNLLTDSETVKSKVEYGGI